MAFGERLQIERLAAVPHQVQFFAERGGVEARMPSRELRNGHLAQAAGRARVAVKEPHAAGLYVDGADEIAATADRPGDRRGVERQRLFDLVDQIERVAALAIHLVDERDDRDVAQPAHFEQLAGARLDAARGVDHHHRRIDGGERAVGVFRKVLVARRVEQVEDAAVVFEGHHRGDDGNAALALDRHPVRARRSPVALGLDLPGKLDGAAEQEQLLGQRGLAGVRMGDDGEGAPPLDLGRQRRGSRRDLRGADGLIHCRLDVAVPAFVIKGFWSFAGGVESRFRGG